MEMKIIILVRIMIINTMPIYAKQSAIEDVNSVHWNQLFRDVVLLQINGWLVDERKSVCAKTTLYIAHHSAFLSVLVYSVELEYVSIIDLR